MPPRSLTTRTGNTWVETVDPGNYALTATVLDPTMIGTASAGVRRGQTTQVTITLRQGTPVANAFVVSFRFDSAFVEPCARPVLREIAARAAANPAEKMLIVGHTDKAGSPAYNQSLGERRARAVFAYLTFGRAAQASVDEWTALRQRRPAGQTTTLNDTWDVREYQQMLQDLGFYPGSIDGRDGPMTQEAVNEFRCSVGLPPGTMDDVAWERLIRRYMGQDNIAIPDAKFFANCPGEILKWVGCGEEAPLPTPQPTRGTAHRPYRRVEVLFVAASSLPCAIPEPDTFNLPTPGSVGSAWCVGPGAANRHCCFGTRDCANAAPPQWCIQPAEPQTMQVTGTVRREVRAPNGTVTLTPVGAGRFVMITPDGEFKQGEQTSGEPLEARTAANGSFTFPNLRIGTYHLELRDGGLAHLAEGTAQDAEGASVCKRLATGTDTLDVVIPAAPVLRQITLPVVAHLMTALNVTTREIRTCPDPLNPSVTLQQRTTKTAAEVRALFDSANRIWEQARIRFDVVEIVEEVFAHADRPDCAVDGNEVGRIILGAAYPGVINAYFFGTMAARGEAGVHTVARLVDAQSGAVLDIAESVSMGDTVLMQLFSGSPPIPTNLTGSGPAAVQVMAHELGHYLTLDHVTTSPAPNRLMLEHTGDSNQHLISGEVARARRAQNAHDCAPLSLTVTGAVASGGPRSGLFITPVATGSTVTVEAQISPELLAAGTVTWEGGTPGATPLQRTVPASAAGVTKVKATYRPNAPGAHEWTTFARILVTGFTLRVTGARQASPVSTTFVARPHPTNSVTIDIDFDEAPETFTRELVAWAGGIEHPVDPLRRTARLNTPRTVVSATIGGVTQSVTIVALEGSVVPMRAPFSPALATVMIEGIGRADRSRVRRANLAAGQEASLFRVRADVPGVVDDTLPATLTSVRRNGTLIEDVDLVLTRNAPGNPTFLSLPIMAIPAGATLIGLAFTAPKDMEVVLAEVGGGVFATETRRATVRGRVVHLFVQGFVGSGATVPTINAHIERADTAWQQAGIEVRARSVALAPPPSADILEFEQEPGETQHERRIQGLESPSPTRSGVASDLNAYYVRSIQPDDPTDPNSLDPSGLAYEDRRVIVIDATDAIILTLAHEVGHHLLVHWVRDDDHEDPNGVDWPNTNIMFREDVGSAQVVDRSQVENIVRNTARIPCLVILP